MQLSRIYDQIAGHHSKDTKFLRRIREAMKVSSGAPWKRKLCGLMRRAGAQGCDACLLPWEDCWDPRYQHQDKPARQSTSTWSYTDWDTSGTPWNGPAWQGRNPSASPRQRWPTPKSPRQKDAPPKTKGKGKGKAKHSEKGKPGDKPWAPPKGAAPLTPSADLPHATQADSQYEMLLRQLRKEQNLSPEAQNLVQEMASASSKQSMKTLQGAVSRLGNAKAQLQSTMLSRTTLHRAWHGYIRETLQAWQGYAKDFQQRDMELEKELEAARSLLLEAKAALEEAKTAAVNADGMAIPVDETEDESFMTDIKGEGSGKIRQGINQLVTSLEQMQAQVEEDLVEPPPSKARKVELAASKDAAEGVGVTSGLPLSTSAVPFGKPAPQTD